MVEELFSDYVTLSEPPLEIHDCPYCTGYGWHYGPTEPCYECLASGIEVRESEGDQHE